MNLLIIAGFLGAGKTSLLLQVAGICSRERGLKVAIVENEVGKVGIDDEVLRAEGLTVREIHSGCICCSLRLDLVTTLLEVEREFQPDLAIVEPSGMAGPKQVVGALAGYGGEIASRTVLVVMDAERLRRMADLSLPLIEDSVFAADLILLNKVDAVSAEECASLQEKIRAIRPEAEIWPVSFARSEDGSRVVDFLAARMEAHRTAVLMPSPIEPDGPPNKIPGGVAHVEELMLTFAAPVNGEALSAAVSRLTSILADRLEREGCTLIGHIKSVMKCPGGGFLLTRLTDFGQEPTRKGRLPGETESARLTLNVIVFGVEKARVDRVVKEALESFPPLSIPGAVVIQ